MEEVNLVPGEGSRSYKILTSVITQLPLYVFIILTFFHESNQINILLEVKESKER